jgi:hypothetical protein
MGARPRSALAKPEEESGGGGWRATGMPLVFQRDAVAPALKRVYSERIKLSQIINKKGRISLYYRSVCG